MFYKMRHQGFTPTTPSRRGFTNIRILDSLRIKRNFFEISKKKTHWLDKKRHKNLTGLKRLAKNKSCLFFKNFFKRIAYCVVGFFYNKRLKKEIAVLNSKFQLLTFYPSLGTIFPGNKFKSWLRYADMQYEKTNLNFLTYITEIPFLAPVSFLQNTTKTKFSFVLAFGSTAIRVKAKKKLKLEKVKLPSNAFLLLSKNTLCIFGALANLYTHKLQEGKYGAFWKKKHVVKVRGVAKNPVDHPNGGRTKSKSPEKSPWGWIAKHNC